MAKKRYRAADPDKPRKRVYPAKSPGDVAYDLKWHELNNTLRDSNDLDYVKGLLDMERGGKRRRSYLHRLYYKYSSLRRIGELKDLGLPINKKGG